MVAGSRAGSRFGQYELRGLLGVGGMGEVYEAYDTVRDRVVALKLLDLELAKSPSYVERFRRESRTAARLQEPHVIPVHDWGEVDGVLFIDMRLVRGRDLKARLREEGPLPPEVAVLVIEQMAAALDAAHESGLVHRDIKPANILLTNEFFAYLVDFGIAHAESDVQLTSTGSAIGSFAYMAPERFENAVNARPAADIYALACVLYECLTGEVPFRTDSNLAAIRAHMLTPPPRPSVRPGVPGGFDQVIATGMAKDPTHRYATAGQLSRAARAVLQRGAEPTTVAYPHAGQPIPAPDSSASQPPGSGPDTDETALGSYIGMASPASYQPRPPESYGDRTSGQHGGTRSYGDRTRQHGDPNPSGPTRWPEHPSAPLPLPPRERFAVPLAVGALGVVVVGLAAALVWMVLSDKGSRDTPDPAAPGTAAPASTNSADATTGQVTTTSARITTTPVVTTVLAPFVGSVSGTDDQGFLAASPRCNAANPAMVIGRTASSRIVVCRTGVGRYYYKGVRISDGASIELDDPVPTADGFTVTNPKDGTQYQISPRALVIVSGGSIAANEAMVEYAHR